MDDEAGYGKPPKSGQFKKGKSGNPNGRPKKKAHEPPSSAMAKVLKKKVSVNMHGRQTRMSIGEAAAFQLADKASRGSLGALRDIVAAQTALEREEALKLYRAPTEQEYAGWLRTMGDMSEVLEILMLLGVLYLSEDGAIYIDRATMAVLMDRVGLEFGDDPILYLRPLSTPEMEAQPKVWRRNESLYEQYMRIVQTSTDTPRSLAED